MFVHSALPTSAALHTVDFLRGRGLEAKLEALRHVNNLGREVGEPWGVGDFMRWDQNPVSPRHACADCICVESKG